MVTTAETLALTDAERLVRDATRTNEPSVAEALAYVLNNDIWQDGSAWRGPMPTGDGAALLLAEIKRGLAASNLARTLAQRHVAGVLGREPTWNVPSLSMDDSEALTRWWDQRGLMALLRQALARALCGDLPVLRILVPTPPATRPPTLQAALDLIAVEVLDSNIARVIDDDAAGLRLAIAAFDASARTLDGLLGTGMSDLIAEIVSPDGDKTLIRMTSQSREVPDPVSLPLGGRLTMRALTDVDLLITPAICGLQGQLTLALSAMGRNVVTAGWVERVMLNAQRPLDADGNPTPYRAGAGMTNWLVGVTDATGTPLAPAVSFREPATPAAFIDTAAAIYWHGHAEARQLHALMGDASAASGEARRQAAADFKASLSPTARSVERLTRWLLETVTAYAYYLRNTALPDDLRASVTCNLSAGVIPVEELNEIREGVKAGLLSDQRYHAASGVEDSEAEREAVEQERAGQRIAPIAPAIIKETPDA